MVLVGEDPASAVYVRSKGKATLEAGMQSFEHKLPADTSEAELLALVDRLNADPAVDGILVQLPLPPHIDANKVITRIDPDKDVDGFNPVNAGRLAIGLPGFVPCTPLGCLKLLRAELGDLSGKEAVVIGRSNIVGKPMAHAAARRKLHRDHRPQPHPRPARRWCAGPTSSSPRSAGRRWSRATG